MASIVKRQLVAPLFPLDTDSSPWIGRVTEFDGQYVWVEAAGAVDPQGDAGPIELTRVPIVEFTRVWFDITANPSHAPGEIGKLTFAGIGTAPGAGSAFTYAIKTFQVVVPDGATNPFTGVVNATGADQLVPLIYAQVLGVCPTPTAAPSLKQGGVRLTFDSRVSAYAVVSLGLGANYANLPGAVY